MAGQVLMTVSRDEEERARLLRDEKIELDYQSGMVTAKRIGFKEGREEERQLFLDLLNQGLSIEEIKQRI